MEDTLDTKLVGVGQDILVELHHSLFVATEEINLDTQDSILLHPSHLLTSSRRTVHLVQGRLRGIIPRAVRVVPQEEAHAF